MEKPRTNNASHVPNSKKRAELDGVACVPPELADDAPDMSVVLGGFTMKNPVTVASGTFAAGDADTSALAESLQGGAFNGLTIVGEFPEYDPPGLVMIIK